jgi:hypothetical protein
LPARRSGTTVSSFTAGIAIQEHLIGGSDGTGRPVTRYA